MDAYNRWVVDGERTPKAQRKFERAEALRERGWTVKLRGQGWCTHPDHPKVVGASIAAAVRIEGLE